jgi:hypothetical protein
MTSPKKDYENIKYQSSNWRFTHMTIDNFCNNARKRTRDDRNSSISFTGNGSGNSRHDDEDEEETAKRQASYAAVSNYNYRI